jgi:sirohydrochlorin ferrochelatase
MDDDQIPRTLGLARDEIGVILVDRGSRRAESNDLLEVVATEFAAATGWPIVEPAHMELAEPSIATAFQKAVLKGAKFIFVFPYLLGPGRHWRHDIPRLAAEAASRFPSVRFVVTEPFGKHPLMHRIIQERIEQSSRHAFKDG